MKYKKLFLIFGFTACIAATAVAQNGAPITYTHDTLNILRRAIPAEKRLPWEKSTENKNPAASFDIEVQDGAKLLNQQGWYDFNSLEDKTGILLVFSAARKVPIPHASQYAPLDILMIDQEGKIFQIAPGIILSELQEPIYPSKPVRAFLLLKGGTSASLSINPGDETDYELFKKPPLVLGAQPGNTPLISKENAAQAPIKEQAVQASPYTEVVTTDTFSAPAASEAAASTPKMQKPHRPVNNPLPVLPPLPEGQISGATGDPLQSIVSNLATKEDASNASTAVLDKELKKE